MGKNDPNKTQYLKGICMPRMSKKRKHEWSIFLNHRGRRCYNVLCRRCIHPCKQSFRAMVVECARYHSKRAVDQK